MNVKTCSHLVFIFVIFSSGGCESQSAQERVAIPGYIQELENLTVFSPNTQPVDSIELVRETVFESNEDVFMEGTIRRLVVDDQDRVFIAATLPGVVGIYVFEPDGTYITRFTHEGRGPAEYESISSMNIQGEQLYIFDTRLQKIGIFSVNDFAHVRDLLIDDSLLRKQEVGFLDGTIVDRLVLSRNNTFLLRLKSIPRDDISYQHQMIYVRADREGNLLSPPLLHSDSHTYYFSEEPLYPPILMPFNRSSLVSIATDGSFFISWTEDFLIKKYDATGNYEHAFFYPFQQAALEMDELNMDPVMKRTLNNYDLPDTWPALHTMELDDEGRLWMATITDSDSTFQWWVLKQDGELLARFTKPGNRSSRAVVSKPLVAIKNGYFYSHERDFRTETDRIVKHKIDFKRK